MSNVLFLGDVHGGHKNITSFRTQFKSEEEHFHYVKERYHKKVTKRDKVYFMGDAAFTLERLKDISTWTASQKILIVGNHCTDKLSMKTLCEHFDEVYSFVKYKRFWLSHCPIHPNELRGKFNIHGHVHHKNVKDEHGNDDKRYFNTSLENIDYEPIDLYKINNYFGL